MARIGAFDRHLEPLAWWEAELIPAGWYVDELLVEPASGVTGTLTATLGSATLSSTGTGPSTLSAIVIPSSNNPSYKAGFYSPRRGGTPKYPSLWDGCVGAWAPSLGATGGILFDHSVYGNHGTLTDMDPASDWVVSGGKGALDFDGSNDYVSTSGNVFKNTTTALFMWVYSTSAGASRDNQTVYSTSTYTHYFSVGASTLNLYHTGPATWQSSGSLTINAWQHVGFIINGSTRKLFLNGSEIASVSDTTASIYSGTHSMRFGARVDGVFSPFQGRIDDIRIYDRPLAGTEIRTLASRRGIAYERASRKLSLFSASAPTGTVSAVLADATLSATGTLTNAATGSLSSTLADASLSSTGTLAAGASGSVTRTLDAATLSSSGELITPSTSSAILIPSSNNPSYRSGFYSPRRGGTPKYPSLWDGCVGAWAPSLGATGGRLFDHSLYQNHGTLTDMDPATDWVASNGKIALDFDGSDRVNTSNKGTVFGDNARSVSAWLRATGTGTVLAYGTDASYQRFAVGLATTSAFGNTLGSAWFEVNGAVRSGGPDLRSNTWRHVVWVYPKGVAINTAFVYIDGIRFSATEGLGSSALNTVAFADIAFGVQPTNNGDWFTGQLDDIRFYDRALTTNEVKTLSTRRGVAYELSTKRNFYVAGSPAITGHLSATLASLTLSSTGTVAAGATGSLASTLGAATLVSSGTVAAGASGTLTRTLDAATLSSSGTVGSGVTATLSVTLAAATLSASGTLSAGASGSVTRTLANATLSSSGTVAAGASGTVTRTLDNATLSATGGAAGSVTGSVASTLAAVTCSSSATLAAGLSGSVNRTLAAVTSSATGTVAAGASGSVTRTLASATLASTGSFSAGLTASVNRALDSCVVSSTGTVANGATGSLSVQLASATLVSGNVALGGFRLNVAGEWKDAMAFVKVTGTWKNATPYVKVSGVWK